jgi:hypothetical protein
MTTTSTPAGAPRRYRFGPLDRAGVLLGLRATQCVLLGAGVLAAALLLQTSGSILLTGLPVGAACGLAFGRWSGRPIYEWLDPLLGWLTLRAHHADRWHAPIPVRARGVRPAQLPDFLHGLELVEVESRGHGPRVHGIGLIRDRAGQALSGTLRVRGREFALLESRDQERVLDAWGGALGGFCRERSPTTRVSWSEWSAPASLDEHLGFVRDHQRDQPAAEALEHYLDLVADAGPLTTQHEVLVTVTVARNRVTHTRDSAADPAVEALLDELAMFARRLEQAGLAVDAPLSAAELALVMRLRMDPTCGNRLARRAESLGEATGVVSAHNWAPTAVATDWRSVRTDQSWHRTFWIAEWPRLEVPADWMAPLVLHSGGVRTLTLVYEPVPPSRSRRAVDRDATRLASDEDQRTRQGFRIRAQHRRAENEVLAREQELVSGYPELAYAGFLTVTAATPQAVDSESADWEQIAAQTGLELRALDGQHDLGLVSALPVGRAPAMRRFGP